MMTPCLYDSIKYVCVFYKTYCVQCRCSFKALEWLSHVAVSQFSLTSYRNNMSLLNAARLQSSTGGLKPGGLQKDVRVVQRFFRTKD